jgi:hypothetical protein
MEGQKENFTPRKQNLLLGEKFAPRGEVKNGPEMLLISRYIHRYMYSFKLTHDVSMFIPTYYLAPKPFNSLNVTKTIFDVYETSKPRLPDFSWYNLPQRGKIYPQTFHKIYQMDIKFIKLT